MAEVVSTGEALGYLGIDVADDAVTANVERCIKTAEAWLKGAVGTEYPADDPRFKELILIVVSDLYDNRGMTATASAKTRQLISDLAWQLRLEMRGNDA